MNEDLLSVMNRYIETRALMSEREKSDLERQIWDQALSEKQTNGLGCVYFLQKELSGSRYDYQIRKSIRKLGDKEELFWDSAERHSVPIEPAYRVLNAVLKQIKPSEPGFHASLEAAMYQAARYRAICRRQKRVKGSTEKAVIDEAPSPLTVPSTLPPPSCSEVPIPATEPKAFRRSLVAMVVGYAEAQCHTIDEYDRRQLVDSLCLDLHVVIDEFFERVSRKRHDAKDNAMPSGTLLRRAFERLGMPMPKNGKIDFAAIKKQYRKVAKSLHPDMHQNGSNEAIVRQYRDVNEAFQIVQEYYERTR